MTSLPFEQIPSVQQAFMNDDHAVAAKLTNELFDLLRAETPDTATISDALTHFYQHNAEHFGREEEAMARTGFPAMHCHQDEHKRVLAELQEVAKRWNEAQDTEALLNYLEGTAAPWFINHLNTMDTVTAMFISRAEG